jgi:hypothetical protein
MRLKGLLLVLVFVLGAGSSAGSAQLPPQPQVPPLPPVPELPEVPPPPPAPDTGNPVEEAKKTVETVKKTVAESPAPGGSGGDGSAPTENRARGAQAGERTGGAQGVLLHCPGEGILGGGVGGSGPTRLDASPSGAALGGVPTGEGVLGIESGNGPDDAAGALKDAALRTGPLALAVFALGALLLLVGLVGGLRALQGRLRSG